MYECREKENVRPHDAHTRSYIHPEKFKNFPHDAQRDPSLFSGRLSSFLATRGTLKQTHATTPTDNFRSTTTGISTAVDGCQSIHRHIYTQRSQQQQQFFSPSPRARSFFPPEPPSPESNFPHSTKLEKFNPFPTRPAVNNRVATAPQQAFGGLLHDTWLLVGVDAGFVLRLAKRLYAPTWLQNLDAPSPN